MRADNQAVQCSLLFIVACGAVIGVVSSFVPSVGAASFLGFMGMACAWRWPKMAYVLGGLFDLSTLFLPAYAIKVGGIDLGLRPSNILLFVFALSPYLHGAMLRPQGIIDPMKRKVLLSSAVLISLVGISTVITPIWNADFLPYYPESLKLFGRWVFGMAYLFVGLSLPWNAEDAKWFRRLGPVTMAIVVGTMLYGRGVTTVGDVLSLSRWSGRISGAAVGPNEIGEISALFILLALGVILTSKSTSEKLCMVLVGLVLSVSLLSTFSRESYVSFAVGLLVLTLIVPVKLSRRLMLFLGIGIVVLCLASGPFMRYVIWTLHEWASNPENATSGRTAIWKAALSIGLSYPLIGVGYWGFYHFSKGINTAAHNGFLESLVIAGIPGLIAYLWFIISLHQYLWSLEVKATREARVMLAVVRSFLIGYVVSALVSDHFFSFPIFNVILWTTFSIVAASAAHKRKSAHLRIPDTHDVRGVCIE